MTRIYTGLLGKFGDQLCFTAVVKKIHELFKYPEITFAISKQFESIKPLLEQDPLISRVVVVKNYMDRILHYAGDREAWGLVEDQYRRGMNYDLRGDDEVEEQAKYDIVFETRIRHKEQYWWRNRHQVVEYAYSQCGINMTEKEAHLRVFVPEGSPIRGEYVVIHNETMDCKQYPFMDEIKDALKLNYKVVELKEGKDWVETAQIIKNAQIFVGVDSAPLWLSSAFDTPTLGLYGINYFGEPSKAIYPINKNAYYLQSMKKDFSDLKPRDMDFTRTPNLSSFPNVYAINLLAQNIQRLQHTIQDILK